MAILFAPAYSCFACQDLMFPTKSDHAMVIFTKFAIPREIDIGLVGITGNTSPKDVEVQLLTQQTHETECLMQNMFVVHNTGWDIFLNILGSTQIGPVDWDQDGDHRRRPQISQRTKYEQFGDQDGDHGFPNVQNMIPNMTQI